MMLILFHLAVQNYVLILMHDFYAIDQQQCKYASR